MMASQQSAASASQRLFRHRDPPLGIDLQAYNGLSDVLIVLLFGIGPTFISPRTGTVFFFSERHQHWHNYKGDVG